MSDIPYPHQAQIWRLSESDGSVDEWNRPIMGAPVVADTIPVWVQDISQREQTDLLERGAVLYDHLIFLDPPAVGLSESDALKTLAGGGQTEGTVFEIVGIEDPDGTGDHYEVAAVRRKSVEDALNAAAVVSS